MKNYMTRTKLFVVSAVTSFSLLLFSQTALSFEDVNFIQELNSGYQAPTDVVVSKDGEIFVLDSKLAQVLVYDDTGYYLRTFGAKGSGPGQFSRPQSITINSQGEILVSDTGNNRVQIFSEEGDFLFSFGESGRMRGQFLKPAGIAVDTNGMILVADTLNNRVQIFSPKGIYRYQIPLSGSPKDVAVDRFNAYYILTPELGVVSQIKEGKKLDAHCVVGGKNYAKAGTGLAVDVHNNFYLTETLEHSIKKFSMKDGLLLSFGSEGKSRGQFKEPAGIYVDKDLKIYATDVKNARVQILQNTGISKQFQTAPAVAVPMIDYFDSIKADLSVSDVRANSQGDIYSLSDKNDYMMIHGDVNQVVGTSGRGEGQFKSPAAIDYGPDGRIYVADTRNNRIQVFDSEGQFEFAFGERGEKTGQFNSPQGIVVNSHGVIYVADTLNNRIQMFNKDGIFRMSFGLKSITKKNQKPAKGTFLMPTALALNSIEELYVVDSGNHRFQIFDPRGKHIVSIGKMGEQYAQFNNPVDIAIDEEDYVYVADQGNHRVQIFPPNSKIRIVFGSIGEGYGQFQTLTGVDVFQNKIYVSDQESSDIRIFQYDKNYKPFVAPPKPKVKIQKPKEVIEDEEEFELR